MSGKWWLVTWTTHGTWLPGDPRGFQTWRGREYVPPPKRYAKPDEATYEASEYVHRHQESQAALVEPPVYLTEEQRQTALAAIFEETPLANVEPAALAVGREHAHLLSKFGGDIRNGVGRLKAAATRQLHREGLVSERAWCRNCHMKSKSDEGEFLTALRYVRRHEREGAAVFVWPEYQHHL